MPKYLQLEFIFVFHVVLLCESSEFRCPDQINGSAIDLTMQNDENAKMINCPSITSIRGHVILKDNVVLDSLEFPKLLTIGISSGVCAFNLWNYIGLCINNNEKLATLSFPKLTHIEGILYLKENQALTTVTFPMLTSSGSQIIIDSNLLLSTIGFPVLKGTIFGIRSSGNPVLISLGFPNVTIITHDLEIYENALLISIEFNEVIEIEHYILIMNNAALESLTFPKLLTIKGGNCFFRSSTELCGLLIFKNAEVKNLTFPSLRDVGGILIVNDNNALKISFSALTTVNGAVEFENDYLLTSIEFPPFTAVYGYISFYGNGDITKLDIPILKTVTGDLVVVDNSILSKVECHSLTEIGGSLKFITNPQLLTVYLPRIRIIGRHLVLIENHNLNSTGKFHLLEKINGNLIIIYNNNIQRIELPLLRLINGSISLGSNEALKLLVFCQLETVVGSFAARGSQGPIALSGLQMDHPSSALMGSYRLMGEPINGKAAYINGISSYSVWWEKEYGKWCVGLSELIGTNKCLITSSKKSLHSYPYEFGSAWNLWNDNKWETVNSIDIYLEPDGIPANEMTRGHIIKWLRDLGDETYTRSLRHYWESGQYSSIDGMEEEDKKGNYDVKKIWPQYQQLIKYGLPLENKASNDLTIILCSEVPWKKFELADRNDRIMCECVDDPGWTDDDYGSGDFGCIDMVTNPRWCWQYGAYSVEAREKCPRSCGLCGITVGTTKLIPPKPPHSPAKVLSLCETIAGCEFTNGECWCLSPDGQPGYTTCGHSHNYNGTYYSIAEHGATRAMQIINLLGKIPSPVHCVSSIECAHDCATNRCMDKYCWGTSLTCWINSERWARNKTGIVRCVLYEPETLLCSNGWRESNYEEYLSDWSTYALQAGSSEIAKIQCWEEAKQCVPNASGIFWRYDGHRAFCGVIVNIKVLFPWQSSYPDDQYKYKLCINPTEIPKVKQDSYCQASDSVVVSSIRSLIKSDDATKTPQILTHPTKYEIMESSSMSNAISSSNLLQMNKETDISAIIGVITVLLSIGTLLLAIAIAYRCKKTPKSANHKQQVTKTSWNQDDQVALKETNQPKDNDDNTVKDSTADICNGAKDDLCYVENNIAPPLGWKSPR